MLRYGVNDLRPSSTATSASSPVQVIRSRPQFPESWLREFCNPPLSTQQLAELLTMSGMEVEELRPVAALPRHRGG